MQVLKINKRDEVLTLSSGGCNSLNLLLHGAGHVVSVDCNPAQSALLELKATAIRSVPPDLVQAPSSRVVCPVSALSRCLVFLIDMQMMYYTGLRLPQAECLNVFGSHSSTSRDKSRISYCPGSLSRDTSCIWPTFALSLLPVATSQLKVALDLTPCVFNTSVGEAKVNAMTSNSSASYKGM